MSTSYNKYQLQLIANNLNELEKEYNNINKISFVLLLDTLKQLKTQDGIMVTGAVIDRIESGVVSAQLTFSSPTQ